jgi:uncharacterized protein YbjT (DUF2867 family)
MKVAIAGARGFVGSHLLSVLEADPRIEAVYALSRSAKGGSRVADLADLLQTKAALSGATHAIYLVHAMSPQAKLAQGKFEDFDLFQADNFARACLANGIRKIFYLGGILPGKAVDSGKWSSHLRSRLEVERALGGYGAEVTALRAGLILGVGGSSSEMMVRLVRRLPVMIAPSWTRTLSEPVDIDDVVRAIHAVLFREELHGRSWDLSSGERCTYVDLMRRFAKAIGVRRTILPLPLVSPGVSKFWVSLVTGAPRALVYPLIQSLRHTMLSRSERLLLPLLKISPTSIEASIGKIARTPIATQSKPAAFARYPNFRTRPTVRSIQRFLFVSVDSFSKVGSVADLYFSWLPRLLLGVLRVEKSSGAGPEKDSKLLTFVVRGTRWPLLVLKNDPYDGTTLDTFRIVGGLLQRAKSGGTLEFRWIPKETCVLAIVQDFVPRLPWLLYRFTQAVIHLWVMRQFARWLLHYETEHSRPSIETSKA